MPADDQYPISLQAMKDLHGMISNRLDQGIKDSQKKTERHTATRLILSWYERAYWRDENVAAQKRVLLAACMAECKRIRTFYEERVEEVYKDISYIHILSQDMLRIKIKIKIHEYHDLKEILQKTHQMIMDLDKGTLRLKGDTLTAIEVCQLLVQAHIDAFINVFVSYKFYYNYRAFVLPDAPSFRGAKSHADGFRAYFRELIDKKGELERYKLVEPYTIRAVESELEKEYEQDRSALRKFYAEPSGEYAQFVSKEILLNEYVLPMKKMTELRS